MERVYRQNGDKELVRQCLGPLERFHEWYWRERDVTCCGLAAVGSYSGDIQHARFETFDVECNMDGLKLTTHPTRKSAKEGAWYGDLCVPGNSAYLILGEQCLMRLALVMGDKEMAARRKARIDKAVEAMRTHMWDEEAGLFLTVNRDTMAKVPGGTIGSWIPLTAGVPTPAMAKRMNEDINKIMAMPDVMEKFDQFGAEDGGGSTERFAEFMKNEQAKWAKVIKDAKVTVEG